MEATACPIHAPCSGKKQQLLMIVYNNSQDNEVVRLDNFEKMSCFLRPPTPPPKATVSKSKYTYVTVFHMWTYESFITSVPAPPPQIAMGPLPPVLS